MTTEDSLQALLGRQVTVVVSPHIAIIGKLCEYDNTFELTGIPGTVRFFSNQVDKINDIETTFGNPLIFLNV